jgi:radical SAM protein with 4Fe4S-binding SPASM domain
LVTVKENIDEVADYVRLAQDLGVDGAHVQECNPIWSNSEPQLDTSVIRENILKATKLAQELGVNFTFTAMFGLEDPRLTMDRLKSNCSRIVRKLLHNIIYHNHGVGPVSCLLPWQTVYVTHGGYVTPCCMIPDPDAMNFGNLLETSLDDIWNGEEFRRFRSALAGERIPERCASCSMSRRL